MIQSQQLIGIDVWQSLEVVTQEDRQLTQHGRRSVESKLT